MYLCDRCHVLPAIGKIRYCKECKAVVITEMKAAGYLQYTGDCHVGQRRTKEMKENVYETIHGTGH